MTVVTPAMRRLLAPVPHDRRLRRCAQLLVGLVLYGVTAAMLVLGGLGLDPWDVLHQGLARTFGLGIGTWAILVSVVVLLAWWPLHQRPGFGTVANAVVVGAVIDLVLSLVHPPHAPSARVALLVGGVAGNGVATGFYIGAGLGPGPRDGLSTGIAARGYSMRVVRTSIEATVLLTGFLLGGTVGIGTVLYALAIGPITHQTIPALAISRDTRGPSSLRSMDPDRARELLTRERGRIEQAIAALTREGPLEGSERREAGDEGSQDLYQDEFNAGRLQDLRDELAAVERAEARLADGSYGLSIESGEPIPDGRLEAVPTAERTVEEQERSGRR